MTETAESIQTKPKEKEVTVVQDQGFFLFETGDTYDGSFEAKKKDRSVKKHGPGVYTTAEGDVYSGAWDNDKLGTNDIVTVSYVDGSKYEGAFKDWCYNGQGSYLYPDGALLQCDYFENSPVGKLKLTDPNGHTWLGKAEQGYGWFYPINHYFKMLEMVPAPIKRRRQKMDSNSPTSKYSIPATLTSSAKKKTVLVQAQPTVTATTPSPIKNMK